MRLNAAVTEFFYSKDFTPDSHRLYKRTLAAFVAWAKKQAEFVYLGTLCAALCP